MNVSKEADAAFLTALENEDPKRYEALMKNVRADLPTGALRMSTDQAFTNFCLGLPTGQHRFEVIAGKAIPTVSESPDESGRKFTNRRINAAKSGRLSSTTKNVAVAY